MSLIDIYGHITKRWTCVKSRGLLIYLKKYDFGCKNLDIFIQVQYTMVFQNKKGKLHILAYLILHKMYYIQGYIQIP